MQSNIIFVGIDISKLTFDASVYGENLHLSASNDNTGFKALLAWLKKHGYDIKQCWFTFEYVGYYEYRLVQFCAAKGVKFTRVSGLEIKRSMGITHGKSDKADSKRIAKYAFEKQESISPEKVASVIVFELKKLFSQRDSFIQVRKTFTVHISEWKHKLNLKDTDPFLRKFKSMLNLANREIEKVEAEIVTLINSDIELQTNYNLLTSIPGIGFVNAVATLIYTENFSKFTDPRKYASLCGVAPFENSSGTSLKGKPHVSFYSHKNLKSYLSMGARSSVVYDPQMKAFYKAKTEKGKHYGVILNAVRFKLILRMFAVVRNQNPYVDNYSNKLDKSKKAA
jgi:transposase